MLYKYIFFSYFTTMAKRTTVDLTNLAQDILSKLKPVFGIKNTLSAGLILLNKLSFEDLTKIIAETTSENFSDEYDPYRLHHDILNIKQKIKDEKDVLLSGHGVQPGAEELIYSLWDIVKTLEKKTQSPYSVNQHPHVPDDEQSGSVGERIVDDAVNDAASKRLRKDHRTA